jgi:hypothetical protein
MNLELGGEYKGHPASEDADAPEFKSLQETLIDRVALESNHGGNWSGLLERRLSDQSSVNKYICVESGKLVADENDECDKKLKDTYKRIVRTVFKRKDMAVASKDVSIEGGVAKPFQGGKGGFLKRPIVFTDATTPAGEPLNEHQRSIIKSHEQAHGVLNRLAEKRKDVILSVLDDGYISSFDNKITASQEVLARITQLRNYFGMVGSEEFNQYHLDYARKHYVEDTGMDNSVSYLLSAIKDENKFLVLINSFPC